MYWSQTESSKWSLDCVSTRPGHPLYALQISEHPIEIERLRSPCHRWGAAVCTTHVCVVCGVYVESSDSDPRQHSSTTQSHDSATHITHNGAGSLRHVTTRLSAYLLSHYLTCLPLVHLRSLLSRASLFIYSDCIATAHLHCRASIEHVALQSRAPRANRRVSVICDFSMFSMLRSAARCM